MKVYLAGPITGLDYEAATAEREQLRLTLEAHGLTVVTPMRHVDMPEVRDRFRGMCTDGERARRVVARDSFDIRNCDAVLVDLRATEIVSIGTVWEIGFAFALNKPIFVVADERHQHTMVLNGSGWRCETMDEALVELITLLKPYTRK